MSWPKSLLMVEPEFFDVKYNINPHMVDKQGQLNKVNKSLAMEQWKKLRSTFEDLGLSVQTLKGAENLPDMVFCANPFFPFTKNGQKHIVLSQMFSSKRQDEVEYFRRWATKEDIKILEINESPFEGMGDALWDYANNKIFGGFGFRTSERAYKTLGSICHAPIVTLELTNENFYHLDTCLSLLKDNTAAFVKEAFTPKGIETLKNHFENLIEVPIDEATQLLACNMCSLNGQDIVIQEGAKQTTAKLKKQSFNVYEVETSEFIKSGGSVFCMKQLLF